MLFQSAVCATVILSVMDHLAVVNN